jgi:hypothetical protein
MTLTRREDVITQAELRKGAEFVPDKSSATRIVRELYMSALARRLAAGAVVEPGALTFDQAAKTIYRCERKQPGTAELAAPGPKTNTKLAQKPGYVIGK